MAEAIHESDAFVIDWAKDLKQYAGRILVLLNDFLSAFISAAASADLG